jgi:hypothetical protein
MNEQAIEGMTVNERLVHFGLIDQFDAVAKAGNVPGMIDVLLRARFSETQASQTAQSVAEDPKRYGY